MGEVIVITSGKGGVGKTTATVNLGAGLAKLQKKVILVDTDIGLRSLDVRMGAENRIVYNIVDVVEGNCESRQAIIKDKKNPLLFIMPAAQTRSKSEVSPEQMRKLMQELKEQYDYVLVDCPPGIDVGFYNAIAGADRALVMVEADTSSIRDADRVIRLLENEGVKQMDLILNGLRVGLLNRQLFPKPEDVCETLYPSLIGVVPDDEQLILANMNGETIVGRDCPAGMAYERIARRILGEEIPMADFMEKRGFFGRSSKR